jgi:hypothetical protein
MNPRLLLPPLLLSLASALVGCSSSDGGDKTAAFVGPWTVTSGAVTGNCPTLGAAGMVNVKLDGSVQTIAKGTDSDLAVTLLAGCTVKMNVSGTVATLITMPVQSCMISFNGLPVTATVTGGTFTVSDKTASFMFSGMGALGALSCPVMGSGTSMKGATADGGATDATTSATGDGP